MKNILIKLLLTLGPKKKFKRKDQARILVVSTTGLGDSLWGTPAIRALRKSHSTAYIALLTNPIGEQVFRNNPHLDKLFVFKDPFLFSSLKMVPTLRAHRFDIAFIFHSSQRSILPCISLAGPSQIVGTEGINKGLDYLLTTSIPSFPVHEIERRLNIVGSPNAAPEMELFLTEEENRTALNHLPQGSLIIGMHPGAKHTFKQWHPKYFIELGKRLTKEKGAKILVTGNATEASLAKEIADNIPGAICVAGKFPLRASAAIIKKVNLFISNDTGPMHIAFAMGVPTIALFCPTNPNRCGPYKIAHGKVIQKARTCTPCIDKKCQRNFCMDQISPDEVLKEIDAYLAYKLFRKESPMLTQAKRYDFF